MKKREFHHPFCNYQAGDPNKCKHCDPLYEKHPLNAKTPSEALKECLTIVEKEYPEAKEIK